MILVFVSALISIITPLLFIIKPITIDVTSNIIMIICNLSIAVCVGFLAFGKDLGKDKSNKLAMLQGLILLRMGYIQLAIIRPSFSNLILSVQTKCMSIVMPMGMIIICIDKWY